MKKLLHGFFMCQSMFCSIPCPCKIWDEDAREIMLQWLPAIGLEIGLIWFFLGWVCRMLGVQDMISGLVLAVFPYLATGFIHLDGFMDVTDAVKSCRSLERRREILKDSHVGSFAVIGVCLLLLAQFAFCTAFPKTADLRVLILIPAVSRCCSVLAVTVLPKMNTSQYINSKKKTVTVLIPVLTMLVLAAAGFAISGKYGLALPGACVGYALALRRAYRSLEGMNGDISGYSQTISELTAVAVLALI